MYLNWIKLPDEISDLVKKHLPFHYKDIDNKWITMWNGFHIFWVHNASNDLDGVLIFKDEKFIQDKLWLPTLDLSKWIVEEMSAAIQDAYFLMKLFNKERENDN